MVEKQKAVVDKTDTTMNLFEARLIEHLPDAVLVVCQGAIVFANPAAQSLFGCHTRDIPLDVLPEPLVAGMTADVELSNRSHDGSRVVAEARVTDFEWTGHPSLLVVLRDITGRKQTEEQLWAREARYRAIVEDQTDLICRFRPDGTLTFVNDAYCRFFGKKREELIKPNVPPFKLPEDPEKEQRYLSFFSNKNPVVTSEHRVVDTNGDMRWQQWTDRIIFDDQGRAIEFQSVGRDITDRVLAERSLQIQRDLALVLSSVSDLQAVLQAVLETILQVEGIDCGGVYLVDPLTAELQLCVAHGVSDQFIEHVSCFSPESPQTKLVMQGTPFYGTFDEVMSDDRNEYQREGLRALAVIPVKDEGQVVASINLSSHIRDTIPTNARRLLEIIAAQLGGVLRRVKMETALRESQTNLQTLFDTLDDCLFIFGLDRCILHSNPAVVHILGYTSDELRTMPILDLFQPARRNEVETVLNAIEEGETAVITVPLMKKDSTVLPVETRVTQGKWGYRDVLFGISRDITELKRAEDSLREANQKLLLWVNELEQRNYEITLLNKMGDHLQSCLAVHDAYTIITQFAAQLFKGQNGLLYIYRPSHHLVEAVSHWGIPPSDDLVFAPEDCWSLQQGRSHLVEDPASGVCCRHVHDSEGLPHMCVPLIAQGETVGMLHLRHSQTISSTSRDRWIQLATTFAEHIALALANLQLRERLHYQSTHDVLTGLFNRRYLEETLEREIHKAIRYRRSVGIIMIDIDHFKQFNDTNGHKAGDAMLQAVGNFLQTHIRGEDVACRYGGEEFTLILPDASLEDTRKRAEQLRTEVKQLQVDHSGKLLEFVSLSLGVASFPTHGTTADTVIRAADSALYRAKESGRDCVCVAESLSWLIPSS